MGHVAGVVAKEMSCKVVIGKAREKGPLGIFRPYWEDKKLNFEETGCKDMKWSQLAVDEIKAWSLVFTAKDL